jgi:ribonucleotide reductase alpha subunit
MCPDECPLRVYGKDFDELYERYEAEGKFRRQIPPANSSARSSMHRSKQPHYMLFKDSCNSKSNQKNLGCIKSSNLCAEIIEYTSSEAV